MNRLAPLSSVSLPVPALIAAAGERTRTRFWEFFVSNIRNLHTRRAYARAVQEFLAWCERHGVGSLTEVQPLHIGTYIEAVTRSHSAPRFRNACVLSNGKL